MQLTAIVYHAMRWWGTFALLSVVFRTMQQMGGKELTVAYQDPLPVLVAIDALIVILFTPFVLVDVVWKRSVGYHAWHRGHSVLPTLLKWGAFDVVASFMFYEAMRTGEFSVVGPLRQSGVIAAFVVSYFWMKERSDWQQKLVGSVVVMTGVVLIQSFDRAAADLYPSLLAVGAAFIFAVVGRFERHAIDPLQGHGMLPSVFSYACGVLLTIVFASLLYLKAGGLGSAFDVMGHILSTPHLLLLVAVAGVVGNWLNMRAYIGGEVVQVSAIFRLGVLTTMFSGWLFFGEDITNRLFGGIVLFIGVVLVAIPIRFTKK